MDIVRKGNRLEMDLNTEDAKGLQGILTQTTQTLTPEQYDKGVKIWTWFCQQVRDLAEGTK